MNDQEFDIVTGNMAAGNDCEDLAPLFWLGFKDRELNFRIEDADKSIGYAQKMRRLGDQKDVKNLTEEEIRTWRVRLILEKERYVKIFEDELERIKSIKKSHEIREIINKLEAGLKMPQGTP